MAGRIHAGLEFLQLQTRGLLDLEDWLGTGNLIMGLGRETYAPDALHPARANSTLYNAFDLVRPATPNGHVYEAEEVTGVGISGGSPPVFPTDGTTVVDGQIVWRDIGMAAPPPFQALPSTSGPVRVGFPSTDVNDWVASTAYSEYDFARATAGPQRGYFAVATVGGTSDTFEPVTWPEPGATVVDGTVTWTGVGKPGTHPISAEMEILDDPATTVYTQGGPFVIDTFTQLVGRSTVLDVADYTFPAATLEAAWAFFYLDGSFTDDDDGGEWLRPIVAYATLRADRTNLGSVASNFQVVMPEEALLRLR